MDRKPDVQSYTKVLVDTASRIMASAIGAATASNGVSVLDLNYSDLASGCFRAAEALCDKLDAEGYVTFHPLRRE